MKPHTPIHYVDTAVFLETLTKPQTDVGRDCDRYLKRLGKIYVWTVSEPVFSEFYLFILQKRGKADSDNIHDFFWFIFNEKKPIIIPPEKGYIKVDYIQSLDSRLSFMDCLHLASATDNSQVFVTIDEKILGNSFLEKRLGLKILHPSDLL